jgi:hypothetical protein
MLYSAQDQAPSVEGKMNYPLGLVIENLFLKKDILNCKT